jgi:hypothetical protein
MMMRYLTRSELDLLLLSNHMLPMRNASIHRESQVGGPHLTPV